MLEVGGRVREKGLWGRREERVLREENWKKKETEGERERGLDEMLPIVVVGDFFSFDGDEEGLVLMMSLCSVCTTRARQGGMEPAMMPTKYSALLQIANVTLSPIFHQRSLWSEGIETERVSE